MHNTVNYNIISLQTSLASNSNPSAMTQLIGRILRQPQAQKTNVDMLNESYIVTHHTETNKVVTGIKDGLEKDGMGDLVQSISVSGSGTGQTGARSIPRNPQFKETEIFLPKVLRVTEDAKRELDYEEDILFALDWSKIDVAELVNSIPKTYEAVERQLRRIWLENASGKNRTDESFVGSPSEDRQLDCASITHFVSNIIPNPWIAREIIGRVIIELQNKGFKQKKRAQMISIISELLRDWLLKQRDKMAEERFRDEVKAGRIQFRLRTNSDIKEMDWKMPAVSHTNQLEGTRQLLGNTGAPLQRSLFLPIYEQDMNTAEREIAVYIDEQETIHWWHRNVARNHYSLQGWKRDKIYPDFICAVNSADPYASNTKLVVLEMKGEHLEGNADTIYKKAVLELMT